jgi:hypothetical protein
MDDSDKLVMVLWAVYSVVIFIAAFYDAVVKYNRKVDCTAPILIAAGSPAWGFLAVGATILAVVAIPFVLVFHLLFMGAAKCLTCLDRRFR